MSTNFLLCYILSCLHDWCQRRKTEMIFEFWMDPISKKAIAGTNNGTNDSSGFDKKECEILFWR